MTRGVRTLVYSFLLVVLCTTSVLWFTADRLLDGVVRHWLTTQAAASLDADVRLERLAYVNGQLRLTGLTIARAGELQLEVPTIELQFSWAGLWQRRIDALIISQPHLIWTAPADEATGVSTAWPQAAPLQIDAWRLENGLVELHWSDRQVAFDRLTAGGGLGKQFPLVIMARSGPDPGVSFRLAGKGRWQNGLALDLDELSWNDRNLLARPVSISPGSDLGLSVRLGLEQINDLEMAELLAVLEQTTPWPKGLHWQLTAPVIDLGLQDGDLEISLQTGAGSLQTTDRSWAWQSAKLHLQGDPSRLELAGNVSLAGSTTLELDGTWIDQQLNGSWRAVVASPVELLQSVGLTIPISALEPRDLKLHGQIEADPDQARVSKAQLTVKLGETGILSAELHGKWHEERLTLACDHLIMSTLDGRRLAEATLNLKGHPAESAFEGDWALQVTEAARFARNVGVSLPDGLPALVDLTLRGRLKFQAGRLSLPGVNLDGKLADTGFSGRLHGQFALLAGADSDLVVILEAMSLDALEYQAEDGMAGLIDGNILLNGRLELAGEQLGFDLSGQAGAAEALFESWYGDLAGLPVSFTVKGDWGHDPQRLELTAATIDLAGLASARFAGSYTGKAASLRGQVEIPQLQGDFLETLQALTGELLPGIEKVSLGGHLTLDGAAQQQGENRALDLVIMPSDMNMTWGKDVRIEGLHGRLPVQLRTGEPFADESAEAASLKWTRLQSGLLDSGPGQLNLLADTNRWRLQQPLELSVAGGTVGLTALQLDLPKLVPQLRASLELKEIDLIQISRSLEWPDMGGLLNARLEEVRISGDEISTVGEASVQVFGGAFSVSKMRVEAPFTRFPTYHADVDFSGIDLYQLTNTFDFGEMNGVADGYIHNLRLFDGIPSALRARLETRSEGTRNLSVKAIHNLNTLSQGGLSAALSQGLYRFIDFYHYRKIGILCWLQNDLFHLEGTARADSSKYLVYGGLLPPRIDVTVSSPAVSFKEMVRRLKRIERAEH